jgi:hypothetical protein
MLSEQECKMDFDQLQSQPDSAPNSSQLETRQHGQPRRSLQQTSAPPLPPFLHVSKVFSVSPCLRGEDLLFR